MKAVKRVYIGKKGGAKKKRPLGLPTWSDKLVAEVVRLLLEAYYDVQFLRSLHGFRPKRGCHTALQDVVKYCAHRVRADGDAAVTDRLWTLRMTPVLAVRRRLKASFSRSPTESSSNVAVVLVYDRPIQVGV